jgi:DDB1- and CUL4-associated factor 13
MSLSVPEGLALNTPLLNPVLPPRRTSNNSNPSLNVGVGHKRIYLDIQSQLPNVAYPPRPVPGSIVDLDIVMEHCDFSEKKVSQTNSSDVHACLTNRYFSTFATV